MVRRQLALNGTLYEMVMLHKCFLNICVYVFMPRPWLLFTLVIEVSFSVDNYQ